MPPGHTPTPHHACSRAHPRPGTLHVAPDTSRGTLSPYLLGSNYGPWVAVPVAMQAELWQLTSEQQPQAATTVTLPAGGQRTLPAQSVSLYILNP